MQRLERLVAIAETLRRSAPRPLSARRMADEFGVTSRTIERDLAALRAAGVPLYAETGRNGGSVSLDRLGNAVVTLSASEAMALLTAVTAAGHRCRSPTQVRQRWRRRLTIARTENDDGRHDDCPEPDHMDHDSTS